MRTAAYQAAGDPVGLIFELPRTLEDALFGGRADVALITEGFRDRDH